MDSLQASKNGSCTSITATAEWIRSSGRMPVGTRLACLRRLLFLKKFLINPICQCFVEAMRSRISCLAAFHLGTSILVPITSTTFAARIEPTSPQIFSGIPSE